MASMPNDGSPTAAATVETILPNRLPNPAYLRRDATTYLDGVADLLAGAKLAINEILDPRPGERILDVGCGTGGDVLALADQVVPGGCVVGVDLSEVLITKALSRAAGRAGVEFYVADATDLPMAPGTFDSVRAERVLQHVADPAQAVAEIVRVTAAGGRIVLAEPDHDMWAVNAGDIAVTRRLLAWWVDHIRNPWMGRQLPSLAAAAGITELRVTVLPLVLHGLAAADGVIGLGKVANAARAAAVLDASTIDAWQSQVERQDAEGRLLTLGALVVVSGVRPAE